jgi:hypothetical protein
MQYRKQDGSTGAARVRWYFTEPGSPWLRVPNSFVSSWWYEHPDIEPRQPFAGESTIKRKPMSKVLPSLPVGVPCGTPKQWKGEE